MIQLDLIDDTALVRGDTYVHVLTFYDAAQTTPEDHPIDMAAGGATYEVEFRNRSNKLGFQGSVFVTGTANNQLQFEVQVPANLPAKEIGSKFWNWDIERKTSGMTHTLVGGSAQIRIDTTNSPGPTP
jgi:hypothetical protein